MRPSVGTEPGSRVLREPHLQAVALLLLDLAKVLAGAQGVSGRFGWCFGCAKHSDVFFVFWAGVDAVEGVSWRSAWCVGWSALGLHTSWGGAQLRHPDFPRHLGKSSKSMIFH